MPGYRLLQKKDELYSIKYSVRNGNWIENKKSNFAKVKPWMKSRIIKMLLLLMLTTYLSQLSSCRPNSRKINNSIRLKGSDTMLILAARWAEEYMKFNSNVAVYVEGGGTERGADALINGKADICLASRPFLSTEVKSLAEKFGSLGMRFLVAKDALSIYINRENPVANLTVEQVRKIFSGEITHWDQIGGKNEPILVLIRPINSGTHLYFQEHILAGAAYTEFAQIVNTTAAAAKAVAENRLAIAYGGIAYGTEVTHCRINNISPTIENVQNDSYPIIRYLYLYTIDTPTGITKNFIDWVLKQGQQTVREVGYVPLWENF